MIKRERLYGRRLASLVLRTVTVLIMLGIGEANLRAAPAVAPAAAAPAATVIFTSAVSEVSWPRRWWPGTAEAPCILFFVSASRPLPSLTLTTSGIGRSRLAMAPDAQCPLADAPQWREELTLPLQNDHRRRPIALRLDPEAEPSDGAVLEGRILALAGDAEAGGLALKVRPPGTPPWLQSFQWFLGIAVPALIVFIATKGAQRYDARSAFLVYRVLEAGKIAGTITHIQSDLKDPAVTEGGRIVYETLRDEGMLAKLTPRSQRKIMKLCYANNMAGFVKLMKRLFPREAETLRYACAGDKK